MHEYATHQLAAIDLDLTLLDREKRIHDRNLHAVRTLTARGIRVVLASGRRYESMLAYHRALDLDGPIIACQGADVRDAAGRPIFRHTLPVQPALDVIDFAQQHDLGVIAYGLDGNVVTRRDEYAERYVQLAGVPVQVGDVRPVVRAGAFKIILNAAAPRLTAVHDALAVRCRPHLEPVRTSTELLELLAPGCHKATGLEVVAHHLGVPQRAVLAFGDGDNDVEMLRWAGLGVAMSHATPEALAAARLHAPPGPLEDSLARAVAAALSLEPALAL